MYPAEGLLESGVVVELGVQSVEVVIVFRRATFLWMDSICRTRL